MNFKQDPQLKSLHHEKWKIMHPTPCLIETSITDHQETFFFLADHNTASNSLGDLGATPGSLNASKDFCK
jgi:hypothetical protein